MSINKIIKNKVILITGGSGSLGHALVKRLLPLKPKEIRIFSRNQSVQFKMRQKFPECTYIVGDIKDYSSVRESVYNADIVIHCAAFKFLNLAEDFVTETVSTNVIGSINLIKAVMEEKNVEICIAISTDKASHPQNVYGSTKFLMERLFVEADRKKGKIKTKFTVARYGNVMFSTGSFLPIWFDKIKKEEDIPVTDPGMLRFLFSLDDSVDLIIYILKNAKGGEIISTVMPAATLRDVAEAIGDDIYMEIIGNRGGEKLIESLISDFEVDDTVREDNKFILIPNSKQGIKNKKGLEETVTSDKTHRLSKEKIKKLIKKTKPKGVE